MKQKKIVRIYGANGKYLKWLKMSDGEIIKARKRFPKSTFKISQGGR